MLSAGLIVFREALEIVIILTILAGATKKIPSRNKFIFTGVLLGALLSSLLGFVSDDIDNMFGEMGAEMMNGVMLLMTSILVGFTIVWMTQNGRKTGSKLKQVVSEIESGSKKPYHLIGLVALLMAREGSEIVLYVSSLIIVAKDSVASILTASFIGALSAVIMGFFAYKTANQMIKKHIFTVSNWLMIVIASGLAMQAANFFIAAEKIPEIYPEVWNLTSIMPDFMLFIFKNFIGNIANPSFIELAFFVTVFTLISVKYKAALNAK